MSCDWNVHCLDCNETHRFDDANHQDELMALLCKHAAAIGSLVPLMAHARDDIEFRTYWGRIDVEWFAQHADHRLQPIDEYGALLTQCTEYVDCACGSTRRCTRDAGHDGEHATEKRR